MGVGAGFFFSEVRELPVSDCQPLSSHIGIALPMMIVFCWGFSFLSSLSLFVFFFFPLAPFAGCDGQGAGGEV